MLLRIEDTDRERSTKAAIDAILEGLTWLGLDWDGDVCSSSPGRPPPGRWWTSCSPPARAYRCYASPEELTQMREQARAEGKPLRYDGRWRDRDPSEAPEGGQAGDPLRAPTEGETVVDDAVQGRVTWANRDLDDLVLLRSDGTPTYMLAVVVVDDHDMGSPRSSAATTTSPTPPARARSSRRWAGDSKMAHIPLIHGADGAKLSKRHGALGVEAYRDLGYLPSALRNYLVRLGWSHGDQEVFSTEEMVRGLRSRCGGALALPVRFRQAREPQRPLHPPERGCRPRGGHRDRPAADRPERGIPVPLPDDLRDKLTLAMPGLKERAKTLIELLDSAYYLYAARPLAMDDKARALLSDEGRARIAGVLPVLRSPAGLERGGHRRGGPPVC